MTTRVARRLVPRELRVSVWIYVAFVAALAALAAVIAADWVPAQQEPHRWVLVAFGVTVVLAESLQVRYYHHDEVDALNLMEGVLAPLVFTASGSTVAVVTAAGILAASLLRRNRPVKALFNASQWVLAASVASIVLHEIRPAHSGSGLAMAALIVAIVVMSSVNLLAMTGVLSVAANYRITRESDRQTKAVVFGHGISATSAVFAGITLTAAYRWTDVGLLIAVALVVGMHVTGRANAAVRADRMRLAGLQRATHTLATSMAAEQALPDFLSETRAGFEVGATQLVLFGTRETTAYTCEGASATSYSVRSGPHDLAEMLRDLPEPEHVTTSGADDALSDALARTGHHRALAVPLRTGGESVGMLLLYDRVGMEGFEGGELTIAGALGRELVGFLERVDLMNAIDGERRKLADILDSTSDGICTIGADGVITSWNTGLALVTGYTTEEMVGTRHVGLLRPRDGAGRDVLLERWADQADPVSRLPRELQVVTQAGETVWLSCSYSRTPEAEGRQDVLVVVARNITQARELERLKDDFVAVVSHELRTPLVPIKGWAQTLLNRGDRLTDDQRRTAVQSILAQAQKLESLVLNILEASRIEAGRADGDAVADVIAITTRIVDDTLAARPDREVRLRLPGVPCEARGSSVWVERSVSNLLANAIKYSPDTEPVDVSVAVEGTDVVVRVTDRGPGIAPDAHDRIFERFERLEESGTQTGTGLGLYITRRLARAMSGDVTVSSVPGAGSTFTLRLPMTPLSVVPDQRVTLGDADVVTLR